MSIYYPGYAGGDYKGSAEISEDEMMREHNEMNGCENIPDDAPNFGARWYKPKETLRPVPCALGDYGAIKKQTVKQLFQKINEELDELKAIVLDVFYGLDVVPSDRPDLKNIGHDEMPLIASKATNLITAITTLEEALGIDAEMRDRVQ